MPSGDRRRVSAAGWSSVAGLDCIRLPGLTSGAVDPAVQVLPGTSRSGSLPSGLPPMAGQLIADQGAVCFIPRFGFVDGTIYTVYVGGSAVAALRRPMPARAEAAEVIGIWPTARVVPRNLLRFYIQFSAPMSEGAAAANLTLRSGDQGDGPDEDGGAVLTDALLPTEHELWDRSRQRLTALLDPARIKRGLVGHAELGYPLRSGTTVRLAVDTGFRDATGARLRAAAWRDYRVGGDQRGLVDPGSWRLTAPASATRPLRVQFDRPLDRVLLARCLRVLDPAGRPVAGVVRPSAGQRSWQFRPAHGWARGPHRLVVDPILEDLAGNSVCRAFDRDLARLADDPRPGQPVVLDFDVG